MWKRIAMIIAWVAATFATATITLAAVGQAGNEVSDRPAVPVLAQDLAAQVSASASSTSTTDSTATSAATNTTSPGSTSTATSAATSTPTSTSTSTSTSTATATSSSTTGVTTSTKGSVTDSWTTPGGTVTVTATGSVLRLSSAIPAHGFDADIESESSNEIEVKFKSHDESVEYVVHAHLEDGEIRWEVDVESGED